LTIESIVRVSEARVIGTAAAGVGAADVWTPPQALASAAQAARRAVVREDIDAPEIGVFPI
jgi:hypothetical protein